VEEMKIVCGERETEIKKMEIDKNKKSKIYSLRL